MRRINVLPYSDKHMLILKSELRLMRAVVRAAETVVYWDWSDNDAEPVKDVEILRQLLEAFNRGARK